MWNNIIGQERIINILKNIYSSGKIAHAYIFYGKEGTGKDALAIEFSKLFNCENLNKSVEACDVCKSCQKINSLNANTFHFVTALPTGKREGDETGNPVALLKEADFNNYLSETEKKSKDHYYRINIPGANNIRIESVRQIRKEIYLTGPKGKKKIFLISNCDLMNTQSANAFLKILEEPPGNSLLILTTSRINSILPTISGRCQKIKFDPVKKNDLIKYIKNIKPDISESEAKYFSAISDGNITRCREILDSYYLELREDTIWTLRYLISNQFIDLSGKFKFVLEDKNKIKLKQFLSILMMWFRDIILNQNSNTKDIINIDKIDNIKNFSKKYSSDNYKIINLIEDSIRDVDLNINPELLLYNLFIKIKSQIKNVQ